MSHTTRVTGIEITDVAALKMAVGDLKLAGVNCELLENTKPRAYSNRQEGMGEAEFVLKLNDATYDVGLYKSDNNYEARTDFYQGSVQRVLGAPDAKTNQEKLGKLYMYYSANAVSRSLAMKGISSRRVTQENGSLRILASVA